MKFRSKKEEMFDSIYRSYLNDVFHACLYLTKDIELAQEMTQQAFVNYYEHFDEVKPPCVRAYVIRTAKNLIYNYYRSKKHELSDEDTEASARMEQLTESLEESYFQGQQRKRKAELSADILADLKDNHESWYEIVNMMFVQEKNHDEIAEELGISKDVLYSRFHRAKSWIRKNYGTEFEDISDRALK